MKPTYVTAASGFVLSLALAAPVVAGEYGYEGREKMGMEQPTRMMSMSGPGEAMMSRRVDEIVGTRVVDQTGEKIGKVEAVVRDRQTDHYHVLVSVGGIFGLGGKEVVVPLTGSEIAGDQLRTPLASTEAELRALPAFEVSLYERAPGGLLVELGTSGRSLAGTGMMKGAPAAASFTGLDADGDGYLSSEEFSAFEEQTGKACIDYGTYQGYEGVGGKALESYEELVQAEAAKEMGMQSGMARSTAFPKADADGDGNVSEEEFSVFEAQSAKAMASRDCPEGGKYQGYENVGGKGMESYGELYRQQAVQSTGVEVGKTTGMAWSARFGNLDKNRNGLVTRGEATADSAVDLHFSRIDLDGDDLLTIEEFSAFEEAEFYGTSP